MSEFSNGWNGDDSLLWEVNLISGRMGYALLFVAGCLRSYDGDCYRTPMLEEYLYCQGKPPVTFVMSVAYQLRRHSCWFNTWFKVQHAPSSLLTLAIKQMSRRIVIEWDVLLLLALAS